MLTWPPTAATILLLWPIITALVSLFYNWLDGFPRIHAVLSLMVKAGIDLPGMLDALQRFLTGALTPKAAARLSKAALQGTPGNRGVGRVSLVGILGVIGGLVSLAVLVLCCRCNGGSMPAPVVPSVDLGVCIFDNYANTPACRQTATWAQCVATIANACGSDIASVQKVLTSEKKGRIADGIVGQP